MKLIDAILPDDPRIDRGGNPISLVIILLLGIIGILTVLITLKSCYKEPQPALLKSHGVVDLKDCRDCHGPIAKDYRENKIIQKARINYNKLILADITRSVKLVP